MGIPGVHGRISICTSARGKDDTTLHIPHAHNSFLSLEEDVAPGNFQLARRTYAKDKRLGLCLRNIISRREGHNSNTTMLL